MGADAGGADCSLLGPWSLLVVSIGSVLFRIELRNVPLLWMVGREE